ncbi:class I adenylate-forming enzyme family protein [Rhodoferax sp.]|uniref:class I adenylate-forming enzyme family protein n=2 Tax=Rhodoferax sp. TaxID=50421 RepID=UPI003BB80196
MSKTDDNYIAGMTAARTRLPDDYRHHTLADLFWHQARVNANRLALVANTAQGLEARVTYAQLAHLAEKFARGLERLGARPGDKVAILADNRVGYEACVSYLACIRAGYIAVPINARFAREEIDHAAGLAEVRFLIHDARYIDTIGDIRARIAGIETLIRIGGSEDGASSALAWEGVSVRPAPDAAPWPVQDKDDISEILFTSGSTARPKAAMLSTGSGVYAACAFAWAVDLHEGDVYQSFFPFFTTAGIRCVMLPGWAVGATVVLDPELDVHRIMRRMDSERTTVYVAVPSFYIFLLEAYDPAVNDLSSLRVFDAGGAALLPVTTTSLMQTFPGIDIRQTYGGTEGGPSGTVLAGYQALNKLGSAGTCWPHTELRIFDDDDHEVPLGDLGEIVLRSPGIFSGYYRNDEASRDTLRNGWLHTGDIGRVDADGYLYVIDRKKDLVIRGGHNIGTLEVERVLMRHPRISEAAVIGIAHSKLGEDLLAVVKTLDGAEIEPSELREFCADKLADFKTPRNYVFVADFPRTGMGKILKPDLRQLYRDFRRDK